MSMGLFSSWNDILEAITPWSEAHAEAPPQEDDKDTEDNTENNEVKGEVEGKAEAEEEEEEEEEEETVDPKETLETECRESKDCSPAKHHFDECVERVTGAAEGTSNEDCVEEFFHLAHCASNCAAPKLWSLLK